jgi:phage baseplate assembly protein W
LFSLAGIKGKKNMTLDSTISRLPLGWPLLPLPDAQGRMNFPSLAESVRQNLRVLLSTRAGEQLMRPDYGAGLTDFLGQPDTIATRRRIYDLVTEAIARWEPRVELDRVDVADLPGSPGSVRVEIAYRLRRTGEARTLGVNLELQT